MAKKTVATLQTASKRMAKVIKMKKSEKSGDYVFEEKVVNLDLVDSFLKEK